MCPKLLWNTNFFEWAKNQHDDIFDAIITDPPYTSFRNIKGEEQIKDKSFDIKAFCEECFRLLKPDGIFVSFCSIHLMKDYFKNFEDKLKFRCEQIWDKRPIRSWISYGIPLRHFEYIVYFGDGLLDFRDGTIKKKYNRRQFGGKLRDTVENTKNYAEGQYEQILKFKLPKKEFKSTRVKNTNGSLILDHQIPPSNLELKTHPTMKPPEFSNYFKKVLCNPKKVLYPCCGSGSLICTFGINTTGIDISKWKSCKKPANLSKKNHSIYDFF